MGFYFAREFRRRCWEVAAVCQPPVSADSASVITRLQEIGVTVDGVGPFSGRLDRTVTRRFADTFRRHRVALVVSMHQVDMKFAGLAAREVGVPYVCSGQNTFTFGGPWWKQQISRRVLGWILNRSCTAVVATSGRVENEFRTLLGYRGRIGVVPNGVDTAVNREAARDRAGVRTELGYSPGDRVFVSVGRISEQKNQLGLVEAFAAAFPRVGAEKLLLVGGVTQDSGHLASGADYQSRLDARIRELRLEDRVQRTGWRRDVPRLLAGADVYVQASLWEGSPLAVVEAMAAGLPVVVADNGGVLPDFRHGIHGWVVPVGDTGALAKALAEVGGCDGDRLRNMGQQAQGLACSRYDAQIVAGQFYERATQVLS